MGPAHLPTQSTSHWKGPLVDKESGLEQEGVLGSTGDAWTGRCSGAGSSHMCCSFHTIDVIFMKPKSFCPMSWTTARSVPPRATVQALVLELENPSRFSVLLGPSRRLSRKTRGNPPFPRVAFRHTDGLSTWPPTALHVAGPITPICITCPTQGMSGTH